MSSGTFLTSSLIAAIDAALAQARETGADGVAERLARAREAALVRPSRGRCDQLSDGAAAVWRAWRLARARHARAARIGVARPPRRAENAPPGRSGPRPGE
jgi:hypothetical protein